jgi:hypothetical protein
VCVVILRPTLATVVPVDAHVLPVVVVWVRYVVCHVPAVTLNARGRVVIFPQTTTTVARVEHVALAVRCVQAEGVLPRVVRDRLCAAVHAATCRPTLQTVALAEQPVPRGKSVWQGFVVFRVVAAR